MIHFLQLPLAVWSISLRSLVHSFALLAHLEPSTSHATGFDAPGNTDEQAASVRIGDKRNKNTESPTRKRRRATTESFTQSREWLQSTNTFNELMDDNLSSISIDVSLLVFLKEMDNRNIEQFECLTVGQERLEKSMKQLFDNPTKIQKVFRLHQVSATSNKRNDQVLELMFRSLCRWRIHFAMIKMMLSMATRVVNTSLPW